MDQRECRPGFCRMWEAEQRIAFLEKQLREAMHKIAEVSRRLKKERLDEEA